MLKMMKNDVSKLVGREEADANKEIIKAIETGDAKIIGDIYKGKEEIVNRLIKKGADINKATMAPIDIGKGNEEELQAGSSTKRTEPKAESSTIEKNQEEELQAESSTERTRLENIPEAESFPKDRTR